MKFCPMCGTENKDDSGFCRKCGFKFQVKNEKPEATVEIEKVQPAEADDTQEGQPGKTADTEAEQPLKVVENKEEQTSEMAVKTPQSKSGIVEKAEVNKYAIASMVLGILSCPLDRFLCGAVLAVPAIIFGFLSKNAIEESNGREKGRGFAIAGIVTGIISILGNILLIVAIIIMIFVLCGIASMYS